MPTESKAQRGAMFAAKEGKSTLGISPAVGKKFIEADKGRSKASLAKMPLRKGAPQAKKG